MGDAEIPDLPGAYVRDVVVLAARWGVRPELLLAGLPFDMLALEQPGTRVAIADCAEVVARAERATREPALAVHAGTQMRLSSHGFLGFAAMTSRTLGDAIALAVEFAAIRSTALSLSLVVEDGRAAIVIDEHPALAELRRFAVVSLVVGLWRVGEALTGTALPGTAELALSAPEVPLGEPFASRVRFDQPAHRLVFPAELLALPLVTADPIASRLAREQCERELAAVVDAGLPGRVRAAIVAHAGIAPLEQVARELGMSTRTLKRRLADHGTRYSAILEDVLRQRALLLLGNGALSIGEVAARLGYTELANFTRAFRKWTQMTPAAWRRGRGA